MRAFFQSEQFHSHTDGAGRDENDLSAGLSDGSDLSDQRGDGLRIGEQSGPGFNDNAMTIFDKFFSDIFSHNSNRLLYLIFKYKCAMGITISPKRGKSIEIRKKPLFFS
jgi:hypothetical protein